MKNKYLKNLWEICFDKDNETRIVLKKFEAASKDEAIIEFNKFVQSSNDELSHLWFLTNRSENWWRIYHKDGKKNVTDYIFKAQTRKSAEKEYYKFVKQCGGYEDGFFYTTAFNVCSCKNKDGSYTMHHMGVFLDFDDADKDKMIKEYRKGYNTAKKEIEKKYIEDIPYFAKTGHSKNEWFDIGYHILNDLLFNIPILIEKTKSYPTRFSELASKTLKVKLDSVGNVDESCKDKAKKLYDLAFKMWKDELRDFLHHLRLYTYYKDYGITDPEQKWTIEYDKIYRDTLPYYENTEDFDYKKLHQMCEKEYNFVMDWLKEHITELWD